MPVGATVQFPASSSTGPSIKPAVTFFVRSRLDPLTDTLMKLERKHGTLKQPAFTMHEHKLRAEYARWEAHDLVSEARTIISEFLKYRSAKDNAEMHLRELHRRANDLFKNNGKNGNGNGSNGNGEHRDGHNGNGSNGGGNSSNWNGNSLNGNGRKEFLEDAIRNTERRGQQKTTQELAEQYTQKIYAILETLERKGEFNARESLLKTQGLQDALILTLLEERAIWP